MSRPNTKNTPEWVSKYLAWGAGPRASQFLILGAKALAAVKGKFSPGAQEVQEVALPILRHRLVRNYQAEAEGITIETIVGRLLKEAVI